MKIIKPNRVSRRYTQQLVGTPAAVFPLLCPVRKADWVEGWDPLIVVAASGSAENDCVFVTPAPAHNDIWYITRHEPDPGFIEMLKITPYVIACRVSIELAPVGTGCEAHISAMYTSLGIEGDAFIATFTDDYYAKFMQDWESRINHYLEHGQNADAG